MMSFNELLNEGRSLRVKSIASYQEDLTLNSKFHVTDLLDLSNRCPVVTSAGIDESHRPPSDTSEEGGGSA